MDKVKIMLTVEELSDLVAILETLPYGKVKHIIEALKTENDTPELDIGDKVRARWLKSSTWYNGKIGDYKDGQYFIKYDDGDEEWTTIEYIELLNRPGKSSDEKSFSLGDRIKARWKGGSTFYNGKIAKIKGSQYFIKYDDGDEEWTTAEFIELI
ncbi:MAG: hypothetical protein AAF502_06310 [Bacteroidota bacterium]